MLYSTNTFRIHRNITLPDRQNGGLTIFSAIILLSLLTLMLTYSSRTQQSEQRISANEYRQKLAFHAAEAGAEQALEYLLANSARILSANAEALPDGTGGSRPGWFNALAGVWTVCPATPAINHPCGGDIAAGGISNSYFYDDLATTNSGKYDTIPINLNMLPADSTARVSAVLCQVDFANPTAGCVAAPVVDEDVSQSTWVITVLSYGFADCTDPTDTNTCFVSANIALPLTNFNFSNGSPAVPLTTRTTFPPTGTAEIVPNPNAGGVGVPVSVWANSNTSCSTGDALLGNGNWATCEYHEWYESDEIPQNLACSEPSCSCTESEAIRFPLRSV
jgi:hypothetical protein